MSGRKEKARRRAEGIDLKTQRIAESENRIENQMQAHDDYQKRQRMRPTDTHDVIRLMALSAMLGQPVLR